MTCIFIETIRYIGVVEKGINVGKYSSPMECLRLVEF